MLIGAAVTCVLFGAYYLIMHLTPGDMDSLRDHMMPGIRIVLVLAESCGLLVATAVLSRLDRRPWSENGLRGRRALTLFAQGAFWGALAMTLLVGGLALLGAFRLEVSGDTVSALIQSSLIGVVLFVPAALVEELLFRGYPFLKLARSVKPVVAAIIMALAFAVAHLPNKEETVLGLLQVVAVGLVFCLAVWRTGSIWWVVGVHAAWNWTQTIVFGCANSGLPASGAWLVSTPAGPDWLSGGATGPEGSVLSLVAVALLAGIVIWTAPSHRADAGDMAGTAK
jgi:membrane protease YdiL (CAAX protease family)